jgi:hypothetical protein
VVVDDAASRFVRVSLAKGTNAVEAAARGGACDGAFNHHIIIIIIIIMRAQCSSSSARNAQRLLQPRASFAPRVRE